MTKEEIRSSLHCVPRVTWPFAPFGIRHSGLVIGNSFDIRISSFVISSTPHLRLPELLEQQLLQRRVGPGHEKGNAARGAILAEPLAKILHRLFVGVEAIFAEGDFLLCAGLGIYQAQVAVGRRV